ncbi:MHYT domain-containing protein [Rhodococcus sp. 2H158]|nr:signaling protein [Rhodococcus rhodochrous]
MDTHVHLFGMGTWVIVLAYVTSAIGLLVGLASARKSLSAGSERARLYWLMRAALSTGGVGVWLAHFLPMAGFTVDGSIIRYDLLGIVFSMAVALVSAFVAMVVVQPKRVSRRARPSRGAVAARLLGGSLVLGAGIAGVHYSIMWAMELQGTVAYDMTYVAASVVAACLTAVVVLWLVTVADSRWMRIVGSIFAGAAVIGVHFLAMAAVQVTVDPATAAPSGVEVFAVLFPVFVLGMLILTVPIMALLMAPDRVAAALEAEAEAWAQQHSPADPRHPAT